jgi:ATP-dependent 26S proteasome regulatory subunit
MHLYSTHLYSKERWIPNDPSAFQLRKSVMEYCILPLGSNHINSNIQDDESVRSILFYGPEGSGKTHMVQTVASEIGAIVINLASSVIGSSFGGDEGAMKLIHMVFTVAKEKAYAPVIIYLDNCHEFFMGKSKRGGGGGGPPIDPEMQRFRKPLLVYKNMALKREDGVLVVGCTNMPESADVKLLRWKGPGGGKPEKQGFFERSLYFPLANRTDRGMLWRELIRRRVSRYDRLESRIPPALDLAALALMSDGINCGEISFIIDSVLTESRVNDLSFMPLSEHEFSSYFSRQHKQDDTRFLNFTRQVTDLDKTWKRLNNVGGENDDTEKQKKKKK